MSFLGPNVGHNSHKVVLSKFIFKAKYRKNVKVFMWIHIQEKPITCERLQRRFCPSTSFYHDGSLHVRGIGRIILIFFFNPPLLLLSELIIYIWNQLGFS